MPGTFAGVRVIELAQFVFVPAAGALLADQGAEVIHIELPGSGDPYRTLKIADVFLTSLRPKAIAALKLDVEALRAILDPPLARRVSKIGRDEEMPVSTKQGNAVFLRHRERSVAIHLSRAPMFLGSVERRFSAPAGMRR